MIVHGHNSRTFQCSLVGNGNECRPFPDVNQVLISASTFEDQRLEQTDFAVVHDSPSIRAGPSIALFENSKMVSCQTRRTIIKRVTWQLSSKFLCSLSVCVTRQSSNTILGPEETRKHSFCLYVIT